MVEHKKTPQTKNKTTSHHRAPSTRGGFAQEFLNSMIAHIIAAFLLAGASIGWLSFVTDPIVPKWVFVTWISLTISLAYLSLLSLTYFFRGDFRISRNLYIHLILFLILTILVTAPLALAMTYTMKLISELQLKTQQAEDNLKIERDSKNSTDSRRIQLYSEITEKMKPLLAKKNLENDDLNDLLNYCIQSIKLNKQEMLEARGIIVYLEKSKNYLVIPEKGFYGFDSDIQRLYFDVSERGGREDDTSYRTRLGVAGWTFTQKETVIDDDVTIPMPGERHIYMPFPASSKDKVDKSIICVGIPDLADDKNGSYIGVLSISSPTEKIFTANDVKIARFFATLLGKFAAPVATPQFVLDLEKTKRAK